MAGDERVRAEITALLKGGLATESADRPAASDARNAVVARLQSVAASDLRARLVVAGFLEHPNATGAEGVLEACETCMYFELHRRFCNLPELAVPVEPEWSCRLWRI